MKRSIYKNRFLVDQLMLNNLESSKIDEILLRQRLLGSSGVVSGLRVTSSGLSVSISPGSAALPSGELVTLQSAITNIPLSNNNFGSLNIVVVRYSENLFQSRENELQNKEQNLFANVNPTVSIFSSDEFINLPLSEDYLPIAIITAKGSGTFIRNEDIVNVDLGDVSLNYEDFQVMKGVILKSTSVDNTLEFGTLIYNFGTKKIGFYSPNNSSTPISGTYTVDLNSVHKGVILRDTSFNEDFIEVDIYGPIIPASTSSISPADLSNFISEGIIAGNLVTENIDFSSIHVGELVEIDDDRYALRNSSANDDTHRDLIGSGTTNTSNPHGIALSDVIKIFESFKGSLTIGDGLLSYPEESVYPRLITEASSDAPYLLLFEAEVPNLGELGIAPIRLYANSFDPNNIEDVNDLSNVQLSGLSLTFNARYNLEDNLWYKDNLEFSSVPAIRLQLGSDSFDISFNSESNTFSDPEGWHNKFLSKLSYNILGNSLSVIDPDHDDSNDFSALLNVAEIIGKDRPFQIPIYEDADNPEGGLRIYMGNDSASGSLSPRIEFLVNAKPILGSGFWTKDKLADPDTGFRGFSYRFVYIFETNEILAQENSQQNFNFSIWTNKEIKFPAGITLDEGSSSVISGNFSVEDISYKIRRPRVLQVNHGDVGVSLNQLYNSQTPSSSSALKDDNPNRYFARNTNATIKMSEGVPHRIDIENRRKEVGVESNNPRLVWRGPERDVYKSDDAAQASNHDVGFLGIKRRVPNQVLKFVFPLYFEEEEIFIKRITIPWDWENDPTTTNSGVDTINSTSFVGTANIFPQEPYFAVRMYERNILNDNHVRTVSSSNMTSNGSVRYEPLINKPPPEVNEMQLVMANPGYNYSNYESIANSGTNVPEDDYLVKLTQNINSPNFYQLVVSTTLLLEDFTGTYSELQSSPNNSPRNGQMFQFRPIIIGNCVVEYDTFDLE